jgi:hypothetical protein
MKLMKMLSDIVQYLSYGVLRIFSPNRDDYPASGIQPFMGDPYDQNSDKS